MLQVSRNPATRGWQVTANSWYSHASVEAFRAELHHQFMSSVLKESSSPQVRRMSQAEKNVMKLLFAGASLSYDNAWGDDRVWDNLLKMHGYPEGISYHEIESVLHWEHDQPRDELAGNFRNIPMVKERIGEETYAKLEQIPV